jgi:hypothetical protein
MKLCGIPIIKITRRLVFLVGYIIPGVNPATSEFTVAELAK